MDSVNRQRMEHMTGGPISEHVFKAFNRIENQAFAASGESHPSGWILALCNEVSFLSGRIAELETEDEFIQEGIDSAPDANLQVFIKGESYPAVFLGMTPKGYYRVRLDGETKVRVVAPDKVNTDG